MPIPTWSPGEVLASADVNAWFVPLAAIRANTQSVTSSTTMVNDDTLFVPLAVNGIYYFQLFLDYEGANGGDLKFQTLVPVGATLRGVTNYLATGGAAVTWNEITGSTFTVARGNGAGQAQGATAFGTVVMSTTAGNLQLEWAQGTSSGTATIMHAQSALVVQRIG